MLRETMGSDKGARTARDGIAEKRQCEQSGESECGSQPATFLLIPLAAPGYQDRSPIHYHKKDLAECSPVATVEELTTWKKW